MNRETAVWSALFLLGGSFLFYRAVLSENGVGRVYVRPIETAGTFVPEQGKILSIAEQPPAEGAKVLKSVRFKQVAASDDQAVFSPSRTVGMWVAALLTLCAFSYLYRDNVFYKLCESIIVGVSAGYAMVVAFWEVIIRKLLVGLAPAVAKYAFLPDTDQSESDYWYVVPLFIGCLVFCRWVPRLSWLARWPLAFVVGLTAGLKLIQFLQADFVAQIRSTMLPLIVFTTEKAVDWKQSIQNTVMVSSVLAGLTYFYFSVEHKGLVGRISRAGVWVLMITFGASFAFTVMGRITLLTMRLQFLFGDWLGLVN